MTLPEIKDILKTKGLFMANNFVDDRFFDEEGNLLPEYKRFNWGAFLLSGIWGIGNNTYIALLAFVLLLIPVVRYLTPLFCLWLGIKGNEFAIKNKRWGSPVHFENVQLRWVNFAIYAYLSAIVIFFMPQPRIRTENAIMNMMNNADSREIKIMHQKALATLENALNMIIATDGAVDMSSSTTMANNISQKMALAIAENNVVRDSLGIKYEFNCDNTGCTVYADVNGSEGPNKLTRKADDLQDIMMYKIVESKGSYKILRPKWYKDGLGN